VVKLTKELLVKLDKLASRGQMLVNNITLASRSPEWLADISANNVLNDLSSPRKPFEQRLQLEDIQTKHDGERAISRSFNPEVGVYS
jgi:hypothetical protein